MPQPSRKIIVAALFVCDMHSAGWAACRYADGAAAAEPGFSQEVTNSKTWGREFMELYGKLVKDDQSVVTTSVRDSGVAMTTKCSSHDLFRTHLALRGWSEVIMKGIPPELQKTGRSYTLTDKGRKNLRELLLTLAIMNQSRPL